MFWIGVSVSIVMHINGNLFACFHWHRMLFKKKMIHVEIWITIIVKAMNIALLFHFIMWLFSSAHQELLTFSVNMLLICAIVHIFWKFYSIIDIFSFGLYSGFQTSQSICSSWFTFWPCQLIAYQLNMNYWCD